MTATTDQITRHYGSKTNIYNLEKSAHSEEGVRLAVFKFLNHQSDGVVIRGTERRHPYHGEFYRRDIP